MTTSASSHTGRWLIAAAIGHLALAWLLARGTQFAEDHEGVEAADRRTGGRA